jgi:hypothetical protein
VQLERAAGLARDDTAHEKRSKLEALLSPGARDREEVELPVLDLGQDLNRALLPIGRLPERRHVDRGNWKFTARLEIRASPPIRQRRNDQMAEGANSNGHTAYSGKGLRTKPARFLQRSTSVDSILFKGTRGELLYGYTSTQESNEKRGTYLTDDINTKGHREVCGSCAT